MNHPVLNPMLGYLIILVPILIISAVVWLVYGKPQQPSWRRKKKVDEAQKELQESGAPGDEHDENQEPKKSHTQEHAGGGHTHARGSSGNSGGGFNFLLKCLGVVALVFGVVAAYVYVQNYVPKSPATVRMSTANAQTTRALQVVQRVVADYDRNPDHYCRLKNGKIPKDAEAYMADTFFNETIPVKQGPYMACTSPGVDGNELAVQCNQTEGGMFGPCGEYGYAMQFKSGNGSPRPFSIWFRKLHHVPAS